MNTPWGEIGYLVYKRTYARKTKLGTEEFPITVERELHGIKKQLKLDFTKEEEDFYRFMRLNLKGSVAGRFMWQLGTETVDKLGLPSLQNCAYVTIDHPVEPFTWAMDMLMLGSGVGFSIQKEHVYTLPKVIRRKVKSVRQDDASADYIVPDTREGWVKLLGKTLKAHFYSGESFTYSTQLIRGAGAPIKGFGGVSSGPEILCEGIESIDSVLNSRAGKKLRPIDCLDIMNIIGSIVVAGNIRRSAQIAIGDYDDLEFLRAKRWDLGNIPNWRSMSNNSIVPPTDLTKLPQEYWDTFFAGEAYGLINLDLARSCGRLGEIQYSDPDIQGFNPCAEQGLVNKETCCLAEVFLPNVQSKGEFLNVLKSLYKVCKHSLNLKCHLKDTEEIVHKNQRMGIGLTGILMSSERQLSWLDSGYKYLRTLDEEYSAKMGWPKSVKLTTVKPSGTLSLLAGVTPGVHPSPAGPHYIRRVRVSTSSDLIPELVKCGYLMEPLLNIDGSEDRRTMVISFPCKVPEGTPVADDFTAAEQLRWVKLMQEKWSDNSVSVSVYYSEDEIKEIKKYLIENFNDSHKTISFLKKNEHGFKQAPYETISKEQYEEMVKGVKPLKSLSFESESMEEMDGCESGACPIK